MPQVTIGNSFELYPNDIYTLQLNQVVEGVSNRGVTAGQPFLRWEFDILEPAEFAGKKYSILTSMQFGPKSKSFPIITALGFQPIEDGSPVAINTDDYLGRVVIAELHITKPAGGGDDRNDIKSIWSEEEFAKFQARFNRPAVQAPVQQAPPPPVQTTAPRPQAPRPGAPAPRAAAAPPPASRPTRTAAPPTTQQAPAAGIDEFPA